MFGARVKTTIKTLLPFWAVLCFTANAFAFSSFQIESIDFEGLQRVGPEAVLEAIPVKTGDTLKPDDSQKIMNALFETRFFQDVSLARRDNTLIIRVVERPTIDTIIISGNKGLTTDQLKGALSDSGIREGQLYDDALLDSMKKSLQREYHSRGQYTASVTTKLIYKSRNRVDIKFSIVEGKAAKIRSIKFIGNDTYSARRLRAKMQSTPPGLTTLMSQNDRYQREKLEKDLQNIRDFYLDNGFVQFAIVSTQVSLTPDKRNVYITITLEEGPQFILAGWEVAGEMLGLRPQAEGLINDALTPGRPYSRIDVMRAMASLNELYGNKGYAFARVDPIPTVDDETQTASVRFYIDPGLRIYVRRINFEGNYKTQNVVLRREIRQMEAALFNLEQVKESERQLRLLSFFKNVGTRTQPVPGSRDLMDLTFVVDEAIRTGSISAGAGYNSAESWFVNLAFKQPNFMGTGKTIGMNATRSTHQYLLSLNYENPYFTQSGVSSGFSLYVQQIDPVNVTNYVMSVYGGTYDFGIPVSNNDRVNFGLGFEHVDIDSGDEPSAQVNYFLTTFGDQFDDLFVHTSWLHNSYDRGIFPTHGYYQNMSAMMSLPAFEEDLPYYKLHYFGHLYVPMYRNFILSLRGELGYGNGYSQLDQLPFFKNYYAGGMDTIRGYRTNTLGPRAITPVYGVPGAIDSKDNLRAIGGNFLVVGSAAILFPQFKDSLRISAFLDVGQVFNTEADDFNVCVDGKGQLNLCKKPTCTGFTDCPGLDGAPAVYDLRTALGLSFEWYSPLGPLVFSVAKPLNKRGFDETKGWDFKIGTSI